jgi:homoserine dehydrogenase
VKKTLTVAIAGLGTVGSGVIKILESKMESIERKTNTRLVITAVSARDKTRKRSVDLSSFKWVDDAETLAADPAINVIVELIGGADGAALRLCENALKNGKHVVTANKALIAKHGVYLSQLAEENNVTLAFEAAVAGGAPVIKMLREGLSANNFARIYGIMNGTCNYILTTMQATGRDFKDVLDEAQKLGYAEADPSFDIDGIDTAHKLAILASLAYGCPVNMDALFIEGITRITTTDIHYAAELGFKIKLLGICEMTANGLLQRVHPCMIPVTNAIACVDGVYNAVVLEGDSVGRLMLEGRGAGESPTASAVVADLIDIACNRFTYPFSVPANALQPAKNASIDSHNGAYYIRLTVIDRPGVLSDITQALSTEHISVESFLQKGAKSDGNVQIIITTHDTSEKSMSTAVKQINSFPWAVEPATLIRIFK